MCVISDTRFVPFKSLHCEILSDEAKLIIEKSLSRANHQHEKVELMPLPNSKYAHLKTKSINLEESITLQRKQAIHLKEIQMKKAAERLANLDLHSSETKIGDLPNMTRTQKMAYRDKKWNSDMIGYEDILNNKSPNEQCSNGEGAEHENKNGFDF